MAGLDIRPARKADAAALVILMDIAGFGLPSWLWAQSTEREPGESVFAFGRRRIRREDGPFSYRNAVVGESDGEVAGMMLGYRQPDEAAPVGDDVPETLRPLLELEAEAAGTWYVNVLAVFGEFRRRGIGAALLAHAEMQAAQGRARGLSIIVEDDNPGAIALYERAGYRYTASRPFVPFPGCAPAQSWLLLLKPGPTA